MLYYPSSGVFCYAKRDTPKFKKQVVKTILKKKSMVKQNDDLILCGGITARERFYFTKGPKKTSQLRGKAVASKGIGQSGCLRKAKKICW